MREISAIFFLLAFAIWRPELVRRPIWRCGRGLRRIARHRRLSLLLVGLTAFILEAAVAFWVRWPLPGVHDEFAYLLQADTFVSGRLTNPPHPLSEFFETYHILQRPTYQSKYPPAQGLVLALGQLAFGEPIVGVWLSVAAAAAAVCWMLQGWLPPRWALLGGLLAAIHPHIGPVWGQSFWGGSLAMLGGSLVFGALPRLIRGPRAWHAVVLGSGLALLANSRPYEGLVVCLPVACVLVGWLLGTRRPAFPVVIRKVAMPLLVMGALTASWMAYYNYQVTGLPWRLPYQVWWQSLTGDVTMRYVLFGLPGDIAILQGNQTVGWDRLLDLSDTGLPVKLSRLFFFYVTPALLPALLMWPLVMRRGRARLAAVTLLLVVGAVLLEGTAGHAHYASPAVGAFFAVVVQGLRRLRLWRWRGKPSGQLLTAGLLAMYVLSSLHFWAVKWKDEPAYGLNNWCLARAQILARLQGDSRKHLILVRYRPDHTIHIDWVKNRADIDNAKVVWAHEREKGDLARLFRHFPDRRVWLLEADAVPPRLAPYPVPSANSSPKRSPPES